MRSILFAVSAVFSLSACVAPSAPVTTRTLIAADAATSLAVGESVVEEISTQAAAEGMDPIVSLALRHADGRRLSFQQGNHTNNDLLAQSPGGALAQIMGLPGEESATLYHAVSGEDASEGAFFCGPQGPAAIGAYAGADGTLFIVGLRQALEFETRVDGETYALPYSPDQVCARLRFRQG
jgi:hypothetical protein